MKKQLTETFVERYKPEQGKQIDFFDKGQPGLILRVSWGGAKTFRVRYKDTSGKTRTHKLGRWHPVDFDLKAARDAAKKFNPATLQPPAGDHDHDGESTNEIDDKKSKVRAQDTFSSIVEKYIAEVVVEFRSQKEAARCLRKYAVPALGDRVFAKIEAFHVKNLRRVIARDHGPRQAAIVFGLVRTVMLWVEDEDRGYVSPVQYNRRRRRKTGKSRNGRDRALDHRELREVWAAASKMGQFGGLVKLLLLTAQRRQCLATARWSEIDGDIWTIREEPGGAKGTAGILKLPPLALDILRGLPRIKGNPFVFGVTHKGDHKPFNSFSQRSKELKELLPPELKRDWTLHDLRRTARTLLTDIGIDEQIGEVVLGHALPGVQGTYNRSKFMNQKADALLRLSEHIASIVTPTPSGTNVVTLQARRS